MAIDNALIASLHREYRLHTGMDLRLDFERERQWWEWVKRGGTVEDLRLVIQYLKKKVHKKERNPGCLKFSNLIAMPDLYEEDKAMAKAEARKPKPTERDSVLRSTGRSTEPASKPRSVEEIMRGETEFEKFRKLKDTL